MAPRPLGGIDPACHRVRSQLREIRRRLQCPDHRAGLVPGQRLPKAIPGRQPQLGGGHGLHTNRPPHLPPARQSELQRCIPVRHSPYEPTDGGRWCAVRQVVSNLQCPGVDAAPLPPQHLGPRHSVSTAALSARWRGPAILLLAAGGAAAALLLWGYIAPRYLGDFMPILVLASAVGIADIFRRLEGRQRSIRLGATGLIAVVAVFSIVANIGIAVVPNEEWDTTQLLSYVQAQKTLSDWTGHPLERTSGASPVASGLGPSRTVVRHR